MFALRSRPLCAESRWLRVHTHSADYQPDVASCLGSTGVRAARQPRRENGRHHSARLARSRRCLPRQRRAALRVMTMRYYITPYDPASWRDPDAEDSTRGKSDLYVKTNDFDKQLRQRWHEAEASRGSWQFVYPDGQGIVGSFTVEDYQIVALEVGRGFNEF